MTFACFQLDSSFFRWIDLHVSFIISKMSIIFEIEKKCPFSAHFSSKPWTGAVLAGAESPSQLLTSIPIHTGTFYVFRIIKMKVCATRTGPVHWLFKCKYNVKNKIDMLIIENQSNVGCRLCPHTTALCSALYLSAGDVLNLAWL